MLSHIGLVYHKQANYPRAIEYMLESARLRKLLPDYNFSVYDITGFGTTYLDSSYYQSELEYLFKQLKNQLAEPDPNKLANTYSNIAMAYYYLEKFEQAIPYYKKNIELMASQDKMPFWNDLGRAYCKLGQCDSAKLAHEKALKNAREKGTRITEATSLEYLGDAYFHDKEYAEASTIYKECTDLNEAMNNRYSVAGNHHKLAETYFALKKYNLAKEYANNSLELGEQIQAGNVIKNALPLLSRIYGITGDYRKAFQLESRYNQLLDSLANGEAQYNLAIFQFQYDTERKQNELDRLDKENQIQSAKLKTQSIIIFSTGGFVISLLLLAIVLYARYRQKQRLFKLLSRQKEQIIDQNKLLEEGNNEKEMLIAEIHHRVKNNLQVISSLLSIQSYRISDKKAKEAVLEGRNRVKAMGLIHENLYKHQNFGIVNMQDYLKNLAENIIASFGFHLDNFSLDIIANNLMLDIDTAISIGMISNELITNSLKYGCGTMDLPYLKIQLNHSNGILCFLIKDNGPGIKYIRTDNSFGLKLVEELTKKLNGIMTIQALYGTEIRIQIKKFKLAA